MPGRSNAPALSVTRMPDRTLHLSKPYRYTMMYSRYSLDPATFPAVTVKFLPAFHQAPAPR